MIVATLAEVLSWPWLALGYVVGVSMEALARGYELGRGYRVATVEEVDDD